MDHINNESVKKTKCNEEFLRITAGVITNRIK